MPAATLSPSVLYTSTILVDIGELMISSKAGTTLPEALTEVSIVPTSAVENVRSAALTLRRIIDSSTMITTITATLIALHLMIRLRRSRRNTSLGISLSIYK